MELHKLTKELSLRPLHDGVDPMEVTGGYTSDLLSDVLARAKQGNIWVTNQKHMNVVAVASLLGLSGVIVAGGVEPDENTIEKARQEKVPLFMTDLTAFEVVGRLFSMGIGANAG